MMKIGDTVRVKEGYSKAGQEGIILRIYYTSESAWYVGFNGNDDNDAFYERNLELIEIKPKNMSINIKEKFTLAFKSEPEKSFRKTGITNGDDFLTEDGQHIFLSWLLKKHGADFKTEVVDDLLKEAEEEKK